MEIPTNDVLKKHFQTYEKNDIWIQKIDQSLANKMTSNEWSRYLSRIMSEYRQKKRENTIIFYDILSALDHDLDNATADCLYECAISLYQNNVVDGILFRSIFQKLIPFYKEKEDWDRFILLNSYLAFQLNQVLRYQFHTTTCDYSMLEEILSLVPNYEVLQEESRLRIWDSYNQLLTFGCLDGYYPIDKVFKSYRDVLDLWQSNKVQALDGDNPRFCHSIQLLQHNLLKLDYQLLSASAESQNIYSAICESFFTSYQNAEDAFTSNSLLYEKNKIFLSFLQKQISLDTCFDQLVDCFFDEIRNIHKQNDISAISLFLLKRLYYLLEYLIPLGISEEKQERFYQDFILLFEADWNDWKIKQIPNIEHLLNLFLFHLIKKPFEKSEKERFILDIAVKRQPRTLCHAFLTKRVTTALFTTLLRDAPDLLKPITDSYQDQSLDYLENAALFQTCYQASMKCFHTLSYREFCPEEKKYIQEASQFIAQEMETVPEIQEYAAIVGSHSIDLDDYTFSQKHTIKLPASQKLAIDLISIANEIVTSCSLLSQDAIPSECLRGCYRSLMAHQGKTYSSEIISFLESKDSLFAELLDILTTEKEKLLYSIYHSFEFGASSRDLDYYYQTQLFTFPDNPPSDYDFKPHFHNLDCFFVAALDSNDPKYIGLAYYASMTMNYYAQNAIKVENDGQQAIYYLTIAREYNYLCRAYNLLSIQCALNGDYNNALSYSIECSDYGLKENLPQTVCSSYFNVSLLFKSLKNYIKALEYLERGQQYNDPPVAPYGMYLAMKGYYLIQLDQVDAAYEMYEQLQKLILEDPDYPVFMVHIFFAYILDYIGRAEESKLQIALVDSVQSKNYLYQDHMEEYDIYFELLLKQKEYVTLCNLVQSLLDKCDVNRTPFHIQRILTRKALQCAKLLKRPELILAFGNKLDTIFEQEDSYQNEMVLQAELSAFDEISSKEKMAQLRKENAKLSKDIQAAKQASAAKSVFLSSISHEIRTPINAILGLDEMILRESKEEASKQYASDIQNAGKTLLSLINDILDFSKLESGNMELLPEEYSTKDMIRELINMIEARAKQKKLAFHVKMNSRIPSRLFGDDLRVKQVILNLLTNAVKYTPKGSVTFSIDFEKKDDTAIFLKISIADTGIGMKQEDMEKLSKPFQRLEEKRNRSIEGTGLGMSIVTSLLQQMGSKLSVESTYGMGTTFSFAIEQKVISWENAGDFAEMNGLKKETKTTGPLFTASNAKILVVDDTAVNLKVVKGLLRRTKVQVTLATSGMECLELCAKEQFHLILLDHRMPEMDGVEALHLLRETACINQHTPVICLTANAISGAYDYYRQEGFDDLLLKPVNPGLLEEKIVTFLPKDILDS